MCSSWTRVLAVLTNETWTTDTRPSDRITPGVIATRADVAAVRSPRVQWTGSVTVSSRPTIMTLTSSQPGMTTENKVLLSQILLLSFPKFTRLTWLQPTTIALLSLHYNKNLHSGVVLVAGADLVTMFSEHLCSLTQSLPTRVSSPASLTDARARHTVTRAPALTLTPRLTVLTIGAGGTLVLTLK